MNKGERISRFVAEVVVEDVDPHPRDIVKHPFYRAFFHCWTRKESLLKAWGGGLLLPLDTFDVSVRPRVERISLVTRPQAEQARGWRIFDVPVPEEFAAAVSVECS